MTKEELLHKGISEEMADEIIAGFSTDTEEGNSLLDLQKALDDDPGKMDSLIKAEDNEGDDKGDDDKDYDEAYMKKYMARYMKKNSKSCQKMMKDLNLSGEKMAKAIDDLDLESEGAVVEMTDLSPFLSEFKEQFGDMVKAISAFANQVETVSAKTDKAYDLMHKAATVQAEQAEAINGFISVPNGRKGVIADMNKAKTTQVQSGFSFTKEDNRLIYSSLMKAVNDGDKDAGIVIGAFESHGHDANKLNQAQRKFISDIISKEAN